MKFKILKGSELFQKLVAVFDKGIICKDAANKLAKSVGASGAATSSASQNYFGGIDGFEFSEQPDKLLWRSVGNKWDKFYYPKSNPKNKELFNKMSELPVVKYSEVNEIVGWNSMQLAAASGGGIAIYKTVGLSRGKGYFIMEIGEGVTGYKPQKGMVEITVSEYNKLKDKIK